jgi:SAM-dependent methyltransferase
MVADDLATVVAGHKEWYHTIELAPGVVTPGQLDLRSSVAHIPWPDLADKRCLDIGTYDGFWAFEMERKGAAEVVATDISDHTQWDWPPRERAVGIAEMERDRAEKGIGFRIAKDALGSKVDKREVSIYDLSASTVGTFDVVFCGSLLLHLRDPMRALAAVRSICTGYFISAEAIHTWLTIAHRRQPAVSINIGIAPRQWWVPNAVAHQRMLVASGFDIERSSKLYATAFGDAYSYSPVRGWWALKHHSMTWLLTRSRGAPHQALLTRPAPL